jgi:hypothetical protein
VKEERVREPETTEIRLNWIASCKGERVDEVKDKEDPSDRIRRSTPMDEVKERERREKERVPVFFIPAPTVPVREEEKRRCACSVVELEERCVSVRSNCDNNSIIC